MSPTPVAWESALNKGERTGREMGERELAGIQLGGTVPPSAGGQRSSQPLLQIEKLLPAGRGLEQSVFISS